MMGEFVEALVHYSFYGIIAYWILTHGTEFGTVISSITHAVQSGTRTMWGFA